MAIFKNQPEVREEIERLYWNHAQNWLSEIDWQNAVTAIAQKFAITVTEVKLYYDLYNYVAQKSEQAIIVYHEKKFLEHHLHPFEVKIGTQAIAGGSVFVGVAYSDGYGRMNPPSMVGHDMQRHEFWEAANDALLCVGLIDHMWVEKNQNGNVFWTIEQTND